jgi:MFS family permease
LILAPAAPQILSDLHSSDKEITVLLVSIWELGEAFAPLILAPLSETYGRVLVYHAANFLFVIASGCSAVSVNVAMLSVFRFLNGVAVGTVALNAAIVGDIFIQEQRGVALAVGSLPLLFSPIVGPISGGYIAQNLGWRWTCWLSVILAGACELATLILFR